MQLNTYRVKFNTGTFFAEYQSNKVISVELLNLSCFDKYLPEDANEVAKARAVQFKLWQYCSNSGEVIQLCAKLVLANYLLHFTEYNEADVKKMDYPKIPLLKPAHLQQAMVIYLTICAKFATTSLNIFTPLQRQIFKVNLIHLGRNISSIYNAFYPSLARQIILFENLNSKITKPTDQKSANKVVEDSVAILIALFRKVSTCQIILTDVDETKPENIFRAPIADRTPIANMAIPAASAANITTANVPPALPAVEAINTEQSQEDEIGARKLSVVKLNSQAICLVHSFLHLAYPSMACLNMKLNFT